MLLLMLSLLIIPCDEPSADPAGYLINSLLTDSMYSPPFPEGFMIILERTDSTTTPGHPDHFNIIAIREDHVASGEGDPNTAPVRDRFKVYSDGRIFWWSPLPGMYIPYEDYLKGITGL